MSSIQSIKYSISMADVFGDMFEVVEDLELMKHI